jgi:glycosyltransferase involved in cell wall biosynthesis
VLRTENEIISNWKGDKKKPLVSVCCTAYNHESYIEDAIKGFLIQETDFPFEILIHDDASTDNTANIIREYEKLYPNIIKVIYQTENQYSQGKRPFALLYSLSKARYIAVCEGDDYWCDKRKLAIQVAYLEKHPEVVISSHDAKVIDIDGNVIKESKLPLSQHRDHSSEELILGKAWLLTMNWVMRNVDIPHIPERRMVKNGDNFFISILGNYGSSHHHSDIKPSAYRVHGGGVWSSINDDEKIDAQINSWYWIYKYYSRIGKVKYAKAWWRKYLTLVLKKSNVKDVIISILANSLPTSIKKVIKSILLNK